MIDLCFVGIVLCIGFGDALRDHKWIALLMTKVMAIRALHTSRVFEKLSAKCASHNVVELLGDELVTVKLVYFLLALSDGTFTMKPCCIERPASS